MKYLIGIVIAMIVLVMMFPFAWVNVKSTEVAVKVDKFANKVEPEPLVVGYHFYNRWLSDVQRYAVATRAFPADTRRSEKEGEYTMELKTSKGQNVSIDMTLQYNLRSKEVPALHAKIGPCYEDEVLLPQMRSEARLVVGAYSAEDIYQGDIREEIQERVLRKMRTSLASTNAEGELVYPAINVSAVLIRHLAFSPEFEAAIEQKQLAAQQVEVNRQLALAQEQKALQVEAEARGQKLKVIQEAEGVGQSAKARAEGEAAAVRVRADAEQYKLEAEAKGNLAKYTAEATGKRLSAEALGGGQNVVALMFAEKLSPTIQSYAYPAGSPIVNVGGALWDSIPGMVTPKTVAPAE